jgi:hypothetical protein
MKTKLTTSQKRLLARLPAMFYTEEDYSKSQCPPTYIVDADSMHTVYRFTTGDARAFDSLVNKGVLEFGGGEQPNGPHRMCRRLYAVTKVY